VAADADGVVAESSPVAYVEGWWVDADARRQRIGAQLIAAAESFARSRGYRELASDTELYNVISQRAHERLGFEELDRVVLYRKVLSTWRSNNSPSACSGEWVMPSCTAEHWTTSERGAVIQWKRSDGGVKATGPLSGFPSTIAWAERR
jgi:hypothetical protein